MPTAPPDYESATRDVVSQFRPKPPPIDLGPCWTEAEDDGTQWLVGSVSAEADISALTAINVQLGAAKSLVGSAFSALTRISNALLDARSLLEQIGGPSLSRTELSFYVSSYKKLVSHVADMVDGSSYRGQSLLGSASGPVPGGARSVIHDENGATRLLATGDCSRVPDDLARLIGSSFLRTVAGTDSFVESLPGAEKLSAERALAADEAGGTGFAAVQASVASQLSRAAAEMRFLDETISYNTGRIETLNGGLGMLVDTDLGKEAARLLALQVRQQLGDTGLPLAGEAPQTLLSLFA